MSDPAALPHVPWRKSFGAKVAAAVLGTVALLLGATLMAVRFETERQLVAVTEAATERSRTAFAEIVALQEERLTDVLDPITGSRRTLAALEAALDASNPDLLMDEIGYGLELVDASDIALAMFTDADGTPVLTVVEGETLGADDPRGLQSVVDPIVVEGLAGIVSFRLVDDRLFMIEARALEMGPRFVGTAAFGTRVGDDVAVQLGRIAGGEVCLVVGGACVIQTPAARDGLGPTLASLAGMPGMTRTTVDGRRWGVLSDRLSPESPEDGWRVLAVPLDPVLGPFNRISRALTIGGLAALLLGGVASHLLSRGLAAPVRSLMEAAFRVAQGDYQAEVQVSTEDELGLLAGSFNEMTEGLRLKEQYRGVLDKVVSKDVAEELLRGDIALGGETREVSVLFADICGFTPLTEGMPPEAVIELINSCMEQMSEAVEAEGGVVDKYVGDELMAIFGAPVSRGDDAGRAVRAAVRIQGRLADLNQQRRTKGETPIGVGVGINTGPAIAGNMGSPNRLNYTVLGETVNLAARICSATPAGEVYVSETTARHVEEKLPMKALSPQRFKGFSKDSTVFRIDI